MTAGMAGVIAAHWIADWNNRAGEPGWTCGCDTSGSSPAVVDDHAAHVADELAKAGYGNVPAALLAAADEMPIETLAGADKASVWLRHRAHSQDPEGHALVKAIHDRKAEA